MRGKIERNSKGFLVLFIGSICIIIAGIAATILESLMNFFLVLLGVSTLLSILSISETNSKSAKLMKTASNIVLGAACFNIYFYLNASGSILTAKLFVIFGILLIITTIYSTISTIRRRSHHGK
ncbi:MAG: hypothetical protein RBT65_12790 [Methanolobus sp.]|jgi:uncharacterized membrane protein HdeD (DUF308 family)|nr:hypothetical protein [Methanolobus sp.]